MKKLALLLCIIFIPSLSILSPFSYAAEIRHSGSGGSGSGNATQIQGRTVSSDAPDEGEVLCWDSVNSVYKPCAFKSPGGNAYDWQYKKEDGTFGGVDTEALQTSLGVTPPSDTAYGASWDGVTTIAPSKNTIHDLITALIGAVSGALNLGTFTGSTIADNQSVKAAIQALETALEAKLTGQGASYDGEIILNQGTLGVPTKRSGVVIDAESSNKITVRINNTTAGKSLCIGAYSGSAWIPAFCCDNVSSGNVTCGPATGSVLSTGSIDLNVKTDNATYAGVTITRTVDAGATSAFGQSMMVASDGELTHADASAASTMPSVCLLVTSGTGAGKKCLIYGSVTNTSWDWTPGGLIYVGIDPSTTTGLTQTAPSGTGEQVQVVGVALTADIVLFQPALTLVEIK